MITIPRQTEHNVYLIDDKESVIIEQPDSVRIYLEKTNIKLFISQLLLLDNEMPNEYEKKFDEKFKDGIDLLNDLIIKTKD